MIDIHCHIIPAVDDGSSSIEESLQILQIAQDDGVKTMVATPHVFHIGKFTDLRSNQRRDFLRKFNAFKKSAQAKGSKIELLPGAEVFFITDLREKLIKHREVLTINKSDYFLLEFPPDLVFPGSTEYIGDIVTDGLIPIICHPERNFVFQHNPQLLYRIIQAGALVQVDAGSIRGDFGPTAYATSINLLKHNMVHVVASDCHDSKSRPPGLSFLYEKLREIEKEKIDMLVEKIPLAIVNNDVTPDTGPVLEPGKKTTFFDFLRGFFK
jgi:protein-tyrosine phosphatase